MTAPTEYPSLDKILADSTPVEPETFDLGALLPHEHWCLTVAHGDCCGNGEEDCDCDAWKTRISVALIVNGLRCDIESARAIAAAFESRIAEALERLDKAVPYLTDADEDVAGFIDEAAAALRGEQP